MKKFRFASLFVIVYVGFNSFVSTFAISCGGNRGYYNTSSSYISLKASYVTPYPSLYYTPAVSQIYEQGICRTVNNANSSAVFIPTKTASEWQSFIYNTPANISLAGCNMTQLALNDTKVYTANPWGTYLMAPRTNCTDPNTLKNQGLAWRDTNAVWVCPNAGCSAINGYYFLYNNFYVAEDNSTVEVAATADDQQKVWIWRNMNKNDEIAAIGWYSGTYDATGPWRCGAKYWKGTLNKGTHTVVFLVDDTKGVSTLGILSVRVNGNIVLSTKNDKTWCGETSSKDEAARFTRTCVNYYTCS